jgi:hypothetical protein
MRFPHAPSREARGSLFKNEKSLPGDQRKAMGKAPQGRATGGREEFFHKT